MFFLCFCIFCLFLPVIFDGKTETAYDKPLRKNLSILDQAKETCNLRKWEFFMYVWVETFMSNKILFKMEKSKLMHSFFEIVLYNPTYTRIRPVEDWDKVYALCVECGKIPDFLQWTFKMDKESYNHNCKNFDKYWDKKWHFLDFLEDYYQFDWIELMSGYRLNQ